MDPCAINMSVSALACALAKGKTEAEIAALSAFFTQLGDSLETISAANEICCNNNGNNINTAWNPTKAVV